MLKNTISNPKRLNLFPTDSRLIIYNEISVAIVSNWDTTEQLNTNKTLVCACQRWRDLMIITSDELPIATPRRQLSSFPVFVRIANIHLVDRIGNLKQIKAYTFSSVRVLLQIYFNVEPFKLSAYHQLLTRTLSYCIIDCESKALNEQQWKSSVL